VTVKDINKMSPDHKLSSGAANQSYLRLALKVVSLLKIPNIKLLPKVKEKYDLIHTPGHMLLTSKPYVIEIDNVACLAYYNEKILNTFFSKGFIKWFLKRKNCKGFLCMSEHAKKNMSATFKDKVINSKLYVVYPYVQAPKERKYSEKGVRFLAVNPKFYTKGFRWPFFVIAKIIKRLA